MNNHNSSNANTDKLIKQALEKHPYIRLAILFGSLAKGAAHKNSDIDLAVSADRCLTIPEKIQLIEDLAETIGRPVDLVDLFSVGEPLLGQIITKGRRIQGDNTRYANLLSKHLFNQADFVPYQRRILEERRRTWIGL